MKSTYSRFRIFLLLIPAFIVIASCKKTTEPPVDYKHEYYPIDSGRYVIYEVDSVTYDNFFNPIHIDTAHFQLKVMVGSVFTDNLGRTSYRIDRYRRANDTSAWTLTDVWSATRNNSTLETLDENLRFVKLVFPPKITSSWAGNSFIDVNDPLLAFYNGWTYSYSALDVPMTIDSFNLDSTLTQVGVNDSNLIEQRLSIEVYSKHLGLVKKDERHLLIETQRIDTVNHSLPWVFKANKGYILRMKMIGHN